MTATYVYCLVAAPRRPALTRVPRGLAGARPPRLLELARGRWLVVATVPLARYGEEAIARGLSDLDWVSRAAVAHERVVEAFIDVPALLPMKLFTLFTTDERAVDHVRRDARRVDAAIRRVRGRREWNVRAMRAKPVAVRGAGRRAAPSSGADYLARKKRLREDALAQSRDLRAAVADVYDGLAQFAARTRRRPAGELRAGNGPLLLDAALLVPRAREARFKTAASRAARALDRAGGDLALRGPWPPYSFIQE